MFDFFFGLGFVGRRRRRRRGRGWPAATVFFGQGWPWEGRWKGEKLQSVFCKREWRERMRMKECFSLSQILFLYVVWSECMGDTWCFLLAPPVWLTSESTRGSCMDPPTIWWYTPCMHSFDLWPSQSMLNAWPWFPHIQSTFDQAFRDFVDFVWANVVWVQRHDFYLNPHFISSSILVWASLQLGSFACIFSYFIYSVLFLHI